MRRRNNAPYRRYRTLAHINMSPTVLCGWREFPPIWPRLRCPSLIYHLREIVAIGIKGRERQRWRSKFQGDAECKHGSDQNLAAHKIEIHKAATGHCDGEKVSYVVSEIDWYQVHGQVGLMLRPKLA